MTITITSFSSSNNSNSTKPFTLIIHPTGKLSFWMDGSQNLTSRWLVNYQFIHFSFLGFCIQSKSIDDTWLEGFFKHIIVEFIFIIWTFCNQTLAERWQILWWDCSGCYKFISSNYTFWAVVRKTKTKFHSTFHKIHGT
jgi:hypothetical protein